MKSITFKGAKIHFSESGKGDALVLLHGFTEDSRIWDSFRKKLEKTMRVITIDLPGHGRSECMSTVMTMEIQATAVHEVLVKRKVKKCVMVGHSMGGYVTLAFAAKYPAMLNGLCLFHSHPFADNATEKKNRDRTIKIVKDDNFGFVAGFIPALFPEGSKKKFAKEIKDLVSKAKETPKEGIIAALKGMKARKDQSALLKSLEIPVLFILGLKDPKAPIDRLWKMVSFPKQSECLILRNIGHMGYIEAPDETLRMIKSFARKSFKLAVGK